MKYTTTAGLCVETWFDRASRNHITQIKDAEGNQIGSAFYAGNKNSAVFNHNEAIDIAKCLPAVWQSKLPTQEQ